MKEFIEDSKAKWVCRECIGRDYFEQYTVGLIGVKDCEVCGRLFKQPPLALVSNELYLEAFENIKNKLGAIE